MLLGSWLVLCKSKRAMIEQFCTPAACTYYKWLEDGTVLKKQGHHKHMLIEITPMGSCFAVALPVHLKSVTPPGIALRLSA